MHQNMTKNSFKKENICFAMVKLKFKIQFLEKDLGYIMLHTDKFSSANKLKVASVKEMLQRYKLFLKLNLITSMFPSMKTVIRKI